MRFGPRAMRAGLCWSSTAYRIPATWARSAAQPRPQGRRPWRCSRAAPTRMDRKPCALSRQRVPARGGEGHLEGPRRAGRLRRRAERRCTAGRGVDRVSGHDRARQRGARPLAQGPHAGDRAADRRRRVAERRRRCGVDPVRDQASESGMTDASSLTTEALAAIGRAPSEDDLARIEQEYLGRKNGQVSRLLSNIAQLPPAEKASLGKAANEAKRAIEAALAARRAELETARLADLAET